MATRDEILRFLLEVTGTKDLEAMAKALDSVGKEASESEGQTKALVAKLDQLTAAAKGAAEFSRLNSALAQTEDKLRQASDGLVALNKQFNATDDSSARVTKAYKQAQGEIAKLTNEQIKQKEALAKLSGELEAAGVDVTKLASEEARLRSEAAQTSTTLQSQAAKFKAAQEAAERNAKALEAMGAAFTRVRAGISDIGEKLLKVGAAATAAAAAFAAYQTGKFFTAGIEDAAEFEQALARIRSAAGLTASELADAKTVIEDTATATSRSALEAATAYEALTREGLSAAEAANALAPALDFATASNQSAAESVASLSAALDAFGLKAGDTATVADTLAAAALKGGTGIKDLSAALVQVGPTAAQLGITLNTTAAALAVLAQNGIESGRAGKALRAILGDLADPASQLSQALDDAGIASRDLNVVLGILGRGGKDAEAVFNSLGVGSATALRALAADGGAALRQVQTDLANTSGASKAAADTINQTLTGAFSRIGNSFDDLRRELLEPLLKPLAEELDGLSRKLRAFAETPEFAQIQQALVDIFKSGVEAAKEFTAQIDFTEVAAKISAFAANSGAELKQFASDLAGAAASISTIAGVLSDAVNAIQGAIFGLAAGVAAVDSFSASLHASALSALEAVPGYNEINRVLGVDFPAAASDARVEAAGVQGVFEEFARRSKENFDAIGGEIDEFGDALPNAALKVKDASADIDKSIADLRANIGSSLDLSKDDIDRWAGSWNAAGGAIAEDVAAVAAAVDGIKPTITDLVDASATAAKALQSAINAGAAQEEIDRLKSAFEQANAAVNAYEQGLKKAANAATDAAEKTGDLAASASQGASAVSDVGNSSTTAAGEVDRFTESAEAASFAMGAMSQKAVEALTAMNQYAGMGDLWASRINSVTAKIREQRDAAQDRIRQIQEEIALNDPLQQSLARLRDQYDYLDDATLEQIAQAEARLQQQRERLAREREQAKRETAQQDQPDSRPNTPAPRPRDSGGGTSSGGITINVSGVIGDIDRNAVEWLARKINPELERLRKLGR